MHMIFKEKKMADALTQKYVAQREMIGLARDTRQQQQSRYIPQMIEMYMTTTPSLEELRHTHDLRLEYLRNWKEKTTK